MKHDVHVFAILHVKVVDIEADSHAQAIEAANDYIGRHQHLFDRTQPTPGIGYTELADGEKPVYYLVDQADDAENTQSRFYASDGTTVLLDRNCAMCGKEQDEPQLNRRRDRDS